VANPALSPRNESKELMNWYNDDDDDKQLPELTIQTHLIHPQTHDKSNTIDTPDSSQTKNSPHSPRTCSPVRKQPRALRSSSVVIALFR
jgi:hypothetical protein